jgi:hypothetical protein
LKLESEAELEEVECETTDENGVAKRDLRERDNDVITTTTL